MPQVYVDLEFAESILGASYSTAMSHRAKKDEMYALGALEATANLIYIMAVNSDIPELETLCQKFAGDALSRFSDLCPSEKGSLQLGGSLMG